MTQPETPSTHVSHGYKSLDRESITVGYSDIPTRFYRTNAPTLFAGVQIMWAEGTDPDTQTTIEMSAGAGVASKYLTLVVEMPGRPAVYEYVDMAELLQLRMQAIIVELQTSETKD